MKRKAILIEASDVFDETDLPGARMDVKNWAAFLRSPLGGLWDEDQILSLNKPDKSVIRSLLYQHIDKYCFIVFSGHGQDGSVVLNDDEKDVVYQDLTPPSEKGTLIIDACRGVPREPIGESFSVTNKKASEGREICLVSITNSIDGHVEPLDYRKDIWLKALCDRPRGIVTMVSCAKGEDAGEDPYSGGYYTSLLMDGARKWEGDKSTALQQGIFTTWEAHAYTAERLPEQQNPEYRPDRKTFFPFAVKISPQMNSLLNKANVLKSGQAGTSALGSIGIVGQSFPLPNPTHHFYG